MHTVYHLLHDKSVYIIEQACGMRCGGIVKWRMISQPNISNFYMYMNQLLTLWESVMNDESSEDAHRDTLMWLILA
jgi:hypothetical protein